MERDLGPFDTRLVDHGRDVLQKGPNRIEDFLGLASPEKQLRISVSEGTDSICEKGSGTHSLKLFMNIRT